MKTFISQLEWRFATKKFNKTKKVSEEDLSKILETIHKAPSSFGLQPFHVFVVSNKELRKKIREVSFNQPQTTEASHLLIFCARNDVNHRINSMIEIISKGNKKIKENFSFKKNMMKKSIKKKSNDDLINWSAQQAYLALGFGLAACAELKIDSCPMEGFDKNALKKVLNLPKNIFPYVYLAIGYRVKGPLKQKFRFPRDELFTLE